MAKQLIDFTNLAQNMANQSRSGLISIRDEESRPIQVLFANGQVAACDDGEAGVLLRGLVWSKKLSYAQLLEQKIALHNAPNDAELAELLIRKNLVDQAALQEAYDFFMDEAFCRLTRIGDANIETVDDSQASLSIQYQQSLSQGGGLGVNALLMEGLRRGDEMQAQGILLDHQTIYIVRNDVKSSNVLSDSHLAMQETWQNGLSISDNFLNLGLPESGGQALGGVLLQCGMLQPANENQFIQLLNGVNQDQFPRSCELLLRRITHLGIGQAEHFEQLGQLSAVLHGSERATQDLINAAMQLLQEDPQRAISCLEQAKEMGAPKDLYLEGLVDCYEALDDKEQMFNAQFDLVEYLQEQRDFKHAIQVVRDAQQRGANAIDCSYFLGRLYREEGDGENAVINLHNAGTYALEAEDDVLAEECWADALELDPAAQHTALKYANLLIASGREPLAEAVITQAVDAGYSNINEHHISLRELLAEIEPDNNENRMRLAAIYQERADRGSATKQLDQLAESQRKERKWDDLEKTLARIIESDDSIEYQIERARVLHRLGKTKDSMTQWIECVDHAIHNQQLNQAIETAQLGLKMHPNNGALLNRLANIALQKGDLEEAAEAFKKASFLAVGASYYPPAREALKDWLSLRPHSLIAQMLTLQLSEKTNEHNFNERVKSFIEEQTQEANYGIAISWSKRLIKASGAVEDEIALIKLYQHAGQPNKSLQLGRTLLERLDNRSNEYFEVIQILANNNRNNPDIIVALGEAYLLHDREPAGLRCLRLSVTLLQDQERREDVDKLLSRLETVTGNTADISLARQLFTQGQKIDWDAIRALLTKNQQG